jgi:NAD(P)-dependent dehydrogenase (short-subunit alcohol dehydrogenase family)
MILSSFPAGGLAVVVGGTGGIGGALVAALSEMPIISLGRGTEPGLDLMDEASIAACARYVASKNQDVRVIIDATGMLHAAGLMPEKSWRELNAEHMAASFAINAIGPALVMKHFLPLLPRRGKSMFATLSAKVGSIGDNQIGGWYSYRAAKAALNQFVHTAAIELKRTRPDAICVALHPGTVDTKLSVPFAKTGLNVRLPGEAAQDLLGVIDGLDAGQSGGFFDYHGDVLPW